MGKVFIYNKHRVIHSSNSLHLLRIEVKPISEARQAPYTTLLYPAIAFIKRTDGAVAGPLFISSGVSADFTASSNKTIS